MNNRLTCFAAIAVLALCGFVGDGAIRDATPKKEPQKPERAADCICPMYPWAFHGNYTSYYAIRCSDGSPVNLDAENNLSTTQCPGSNPCAADCVYVPGSLRTGTKQRLFSTKSRAIAIPADDGDQPHEYVQVTRKDEKDGIGKKGAAIYWDDELPATPGIRPFKNVVLRVNLKNGDDFKVRLLAYKVKLPGSVAERVFVLGVHVQNGEPNAVIPKEHVKHSESRRVCAIRYDFQDNVISTKWHRVMCHKDRELPE